MKKISIILFLGFIIMSSVFLILSVRGINGNPTAQELNSKQWKENGPFELSPERGRFALLYSMVEDNSFQFSNDIGQFAMPDVGFHNGRYVSLFAPLISFIAVPGYIIGKYYGISQVGTFAVIAIFALLNLILIRLIAIRLGVHHVIATVTASIFLFATPAFTYAVSLYQHHISTFLILLSIYLLLRTKRVWVLPIIFLLCAASIPLDYPNLFLMFPIGVYALARTISVQKVKEKLSLSIHFLRLTTLLIMIIPLLFFFWFNKQSYDNPFQLSGTVQSVQSTEDKVTTDLASLSETKRLKKEESAVKRNPFAFFQTRNLITGFYQHLLSVDRGILWFTPIMLFSIFGMFILYKKNQAITALLLSIIGATVLLYSMWGDPYGGWAFGSRYMIPAYAIMSLFIAVAVQRFIKNYVFIGFFALVMIYSVFVNTAGAITSSANPPKVEALALEKITKKEEKYTYERNLDMLKNNTSKSFVWRTYLKKDITAMNYYYSLAGSISAIITVLLIGLFIHERRKSDAKI